VIYFYHSVLVIYLVYSVTMRIHGALGVCVKIVLLEYCFIYLFSHFLHCLSVRCSQGYFVVEV